MIDNLRLYVWTDVLCDYTCGIAFALAPDAETAREMCADAYVEDIDWVEAGDFKRWHQGEYDSKSYVVGFWKELCEEPLVVEEPRGFAVSGGG